MLEEIDALFERLKTAALKDEHIAEQEIRNVVSGLGAVVVKDIRRIADALEAIAAKTNA